MIVTIDSECIQAKINEMKYTTKGCAECERDLFVQEIGICCNRYYDTTHVRFKMFAVECAVT